MLIGYYTFACQERKVRFFALVAVESSKTCFFIYFYFLEDEQTTGQGLSVNMEPGTTELTDPAILECRVEQRYTYTPEELLKLKNVPLTRQKPVFINYVQNM